MAPRKQPKRLEESVLEFVADKCANAVKGHLENCNAAEVEPYITRVQDQVCDYIPSPLFNDFAVMFLQRIFKKNGLDNYSWGRSVEHWMNEHGTDIVDVIVHDGLTKLENGFPGVSPAVMHVLRNTAYRLRNLRHLHYEIVSCGCLYALKTCNLANLTTFGCNKACTDEILRLIAERCPNLTTLHIEDSPGITSDGLYALKQCSKLSTVKSDDLTIKAPDQIEHLLSHGGIRNIAYSIYHLIHIMRFEGGVYPEFTSLHIYEVEINEAALGVIVKSFPSLDTLFFSGSCEITRDLLPLEDLLFLNSLGMLGIENLRLEQVESLLRKVGNKYSSLCLNLNIHQLQQAVNVIYETCKNLKYLELYVWPDDADQSLRTITIPPFENLESLRVECWFSFRMRSDHMQFIRLSALQKIYLDGFFVDIKSMLLDHDNFPRITEINYRRMLSSSECIEFEIIRNIIQRNNLEVHYNEGE